MGDPQRRRTSRQGWRIVAGGVLPLIFGFSLLSNHYGPGWFALLLIGIGVAMMVAGRRM